MMPLWREIHPVQNSFGFPVGQPANHHVMGGGFSLNDWFAFISRERGHLRLRFAEDGSGCLVSSLAKQAHRAEQASGSRNIVVLASRLLSDSQGLFCAGILAIAILSEAQAQ